MTQAGIRKADMAVVDACRVALGRLDLASTVNQDGGTLVPSACDRTVEGKSLSREITR